MRFIWGILIAIIHIFYFSHANEKCKITVAVESTHLRTDWPGCEVIRIVLSNIALVLRNPFFH